MQRALFLYVPGDAWRAHVVASKWVGSGRVVLAADDFGWNELAPRGGVDGIAWEPEPSVVLVLVTQETGSDRGVQAGVKEAVRRGIPVVGIDVAGIRDESGARSAAGESWPEFRQFYRWWLDKGEVEIGEWIDYEISASATHGS